MSTRFGKRSDLGRHSRPFRWLDDSLRDLRSDLEAVDSSLEALELLLASSDGKLVPDAVHNRRFVTMLTQLSPSERTSRFNRLRRHNHEHVLHVLYAHYVEYLRRLLQSLYQHAPLQVAGKVPGKVTYHDLIRMGTFDSVEQHIVDSVFRSLQSDRPGKLLERIVDHTGIVVDDTLREAAALALDTRHLLVHNAGRVDADFVRRHGTRMPYTVEDGSRLPLSKGYARKAIGSVYELLRDVDTRLVEAKYVSTE